MYTVLIVVYTTLNAVLIITGEKKKFKMDKFKTCKDCPDRTIEPNCHENCEGYNYRKSENEKLYEERKKRCDYMTFKGHAISYNVRGTSNGMLKVRKGGVHDG